LGLAGKVGISRLYLLKLSVAVCHIVVTEQVDIPHNIAVQFCLQGTTCCKFKSGYQHKSSEM
jgi:hypothetical protein